MRSGRSLLMVLRGAISSLTQWFAHKGLLSCNGLGLCASTFCRRRVKRAHLPAPGQLLWILVFCTVCQHLPHSLQSKTVAGLPSTPRPRWKSLVNQTQLGPDRLQPAFSGQRCFFHVWLPSLARLLFTSGFTTGDGQWQLRSLASDVQKLPMPWTSSYDMCSLQPFVESALIPSNFKAPKLYPHDPFLWGPPVTAERSGQGLQGEVGFPC